LVSPRTEGDLVMRLYVSTLAIAVATALALAEGFLGGWKW
jgi:hypothetical protein